MKTFVLFLILNFPGWPAPDVEVARTNLPSMEACDMEGQRALEEFEVTVQEANTGATLSYVCLDSVTAAKFMNNEQTSL